MPIEGIESTDTSQTEDKQTQATSDETVKKTDASESGTDTQTANTEAQKEKTFTQADVDRIVANRIKSGVKAELKKLTGDEAVSVDELQRQLSETQTRAQSLEAREAIRDYLSDPDNKLNVKNPAAVVKFVMPDIEFDDQGKPSNLKEVLKSAKILAPELFTNIPASINAGNGRNGAVIDNDMNARIRKGAGF